MLLSGNGTPKGAARLRVGDAVFLKTIRGSWLHGTVPHRALALRQGSVWEKLCASGRKRAHYR